MKLPKHLERLRRIKESKEGFSSYWSTIKSLDECQSLAEGKKTHASILKYYLGDSLWHGNRLMCMYSQCGSIQEARQVFEEMPERDVISWNTIIAAYSRSADAESTAEAMKMFLRMSREHEMGCGFLPTALTFTSIFKACAECRAAFEGQQVHALAVKCTTTSDVFLEGALMKMYCNIKNIKDARQVFDKMSIQTPISWKEMVAGLTQNREYRDALLVFKDMARALVPLDDYALSTVLTSCGRSSDLKLGAQAHGLVVRRNWESHYVVGNAVVDMYARCESIEDAVLAFTRIENRTIPNWNALLAGLAHRGLGKSALKMFESMLDYGAKPNEITFACVLHACSECGMVNEGKELFKSMKKKYGVIPNVRHYTCMVHLFCKCGLVKKAEALIKKMPCSPDAVFWRCLFSGLQKNSNIMAEGQSEQKQISSCM